MADAAPEPDHGNRAWVADLLQHVDAGELPRGDLHPCPYLPDRQARSMAFRSPDFDGDVYHALMDRGFRRTGDVFYAMDCPSCRKCVPIRVPVQQFVPSRSQRRAWRRNQDIEVRVRVPELHPETWELYERYVRHQHGRLSPDDNPQSLAESLYARCVQTVEATYHLGERLVAVSILDVCRSSVSSVYHFFEPAEQRRSLGVFSVLAEIEWCKQLGIPHYYLGFWIEGAPTMAYKANYRPHELLRDGTWQRA